MKIVKDNWELIFVWARYNLEESYIATRAGIFWIVIQPVYYTLLYTVIFKYLLGRDVREGVPYVLFFLVGTTSWNLFQKNWNQAPLSIVRKLNFLSEMKVKPEILVFAQLVEYLFEYLINLIILFLASLIMGFYPTLYFLFLPLILTFMVTLTLGGMFMLSSLGVIIRDIPRLVGVGLQLLFFLSGVMITMDMLPEKYHLILNLNPIMHMIESIRSVIIYQESPPLFSMIYMGLSSVAVLGVGYLYFSKKKGVFVDYK